MALEGIVFDIQKFCMHDGPGIRTSVFLKGCMMRCIWCHNPESFAQEPQLSYDESRCISCRACAGVCPEGVHTFDEAGHHQVDFPKCTACGACVKVCPVQCLKIFGKPMTAQQVISEVLKDRKYYESSGGGVTFTGGEPSMQFDFLLELMTLAKEEGLHVCLETNGIIAPERLLTLVPLTDLFLLDYKATGESHRRLTGAEEETVIRSIDVIHHAGGKMILRCPIVQGINDDDAHFEQIKFLKNKYSSIQSAEIMSYHAVGAGKWRSIGMDYTLDGLPSATPEMKAEWEEKIK